MVTGEAQAAIEAAHRDNIAKIQSEFSRVAAAYEEWKAQQDARIMALERQLTETKMQLDEELTLYAGQQAASLAQAQMQVEAYAQAVARAITATENPYRYGTNAPTVPTQSAAPGPLSLPG